MASLRFFMAEHLGVRSWLRHSQGGRRADFELLFSVGLHPMTRCRQGKAVCSPRPQPKYSTPNGLRGSRKNKNLRNNLPHGKQNLIKPWQRTCYSRMRNLVEPVADPGSRRVVPDTFESVSWGFAADIPSCSRLPAARSLLSDNRQNRQGYAALFAIRRWTTRDLAGPLTNLCA